jgi:hypothetical protein
VKEHIDIIRKFYFIKQEIMSKESEITQLKAALQEEKHANGRLRADIKLKSQELKVQEEKVRATVLILFHDLVFSFLFRNSDCIEQNYCQ